MSKYSAINIGPIFKTISMARKPRGLWAASYLFSLLMKCIIEQMSHDSIISPAVSGEMRKDVGLYPDRLFLKGEVDSEALNRAIESFSIKSSLSSDTVKGYFNIMHVTIESSSVSDAIKCLNNKLDCLELFERAVDSKYEQAVIDLISMRCDSSLFQEAFGEHDFKIPELERIASNGRTGKESYNDYFCIVQADGDRMGEIITSPGTSIDKVSAALLDFGNDAVGKIRFYSRHSLPIYAGGDDLLFIVPVIGNDGRNILDLLDEIDCLYAEKVKSVADNEIMQTSMSYGVAICYHKYPLYEAFATARTQLFGVAKNVAGKNAIAIDLRKHSGGAFSISLSKGNTELYQAFRSMVEASDKDSSEAVVSAVAHKIRNNVGLLQLWVDSSNDYRCRNLNFFKKYMEYSEGNKYKDASLALLNALYASISRSRQKDALQDESEKNIEWIVQNIYGMLRIAKFMKGEERNE